MMLLIYLCSKNKIIIPEVKKKKLPFKIVQNSTHHTANKKMQVLKGFVFYPTLDYILAGLAGVEKRSSQETLNLICAIRHLIQLKPKINDLSILSNKFNLDSDQFEAEIKLLKNMPDIDFPSGSSNKIIKA